MISERPQLNAMGAWHVQKIWRCSAGGTQSTVCEQGGSTNLRLATGGGAVRAKNDEQMKDERCTKCGKTYMARYVM